MTVESRDVSVIVQGPITDITGECLRSIRINFPDSEIILSTWLDSNVSGLDFDILVTSVDPGGDLVNFRPDPKRLNNVNRMIRSCRAGLQGASRQFAIKTRTDIKFQSSKILKQWRSIGNRCEEYKLFSECLIVSSHFTRNPKREFPYPFHVSDMVQFGLTADLSKLWEVPEAPTSEFSWFKERGRPVPDVDTETDQRYAPEQYVYIAALRSAGFEVSCEHQFDLTTKSLSQHDLALANNVIVANPEDLGYVWRSNELPAHDWHSIYGMKEFANLQRRILSKSVGGLPDLETLFKELHYEWFGRSLRSTERRNRLIHSKNHALAQIDRIFVRAPRKLYKMLFRK